MFEHFIVTRFNLRVSEWKTTKNGLDVLSDEWMDDRLEKFEKYCLPSVLNQKNKNFKWLIFFDKMTSNKYLQKIDDLTKISSNIYCYFINGITELKQAFTDAIKSFPAKDNKWIITTRLDNDDIIHEKFVEEIQNNFTPVHETIIDLRNGLQLNIQKEQAEVKELHNEFNPFISLIENCEQFQTVISKPHRDWKSAKNIIVLDAYPLWIEVIHTNNKLNEADEKKLLSKSFNCQEFGLSKDLKFISNHQILFKNSKKRLTAFLNNRRKSFK